MIFILIILQHGICGFQVTMHVTHRCCTNYMYPFHTGAREGIASDAAQMKQVKDHVSESNEGTM